MSSFDLWLWLSCPANRRADAGERTLTQQSELAKQLCLRLSFHSSFNALDIDDLRMDHTANNDFLQRKPKRT